MRVLWLIKGLGPGGAETLLVNQARAADGDIDYSAAYLIAWKDHLVADLQHAGVTVTCLDAPREWDLRWARRLRQIVVRDRIDLVHVHSPYVAAVTRLALRTLPRARRPALVYTEHNEWPRHDRATRWANRLTIGLDDVDLAVSADVRASMPSSVARRVEVLTHGIDVDRTAGQARHRHEVRAELGVASSDVVVGIVANFRAEKAYDDWIEAARLVPPELAVRFVSVGQGPLEDEMRRRVMTAGLDGRITLLGYRDDAARVMSAFDIFTLSSIHEGLPVSLMEALALGLPVAATTAGGIPQGVTDGVEGLLVAPRHPDRLAAAITRLATESELRTAMGTAAAERADEFDIARAMTRLEAIYADAVRRPDRSLGSSRA